MRRVFDAPIARPPRRALLSGLALMAALSACGPRQPGAEPDRTYYWQVTSSEVAFDRCTDDAQFRADLQPIAFDANSYFIYRVDASASTATVMSCTTFRPASCVPSTPQVELTIAGNEYLFSAESRSAIGTQGCQLQDSTTWSALDQGPTLALTITHVLSLVDAPQACDAVEHQLVASSGNATGLQGCVVTFKVGAEL